VLQVTQGVQTRAFVYDGLNRVKSAQSPEAGTVAYSYAGCSKDPSDLCSRTDGRGVITNYSYDALNRPYQISYNVGTTGVPSTTTVTYSYGTSGASHNNGRLTGVGDVTYSDAYTYDFLGNLASVAKTLAGQTYTIQYQYNEARLVTRTTYPSSMYLTEAYANTGQLSSVTENNGKQYATGLTYNSAGQLTGYAMGLSGGTVNATLGYSAQRLQLGSISYTYGANTLFSLTYGYSQNSGNNGQITAVNDGLSSGRSATYGFDALSRLTSFSTTGSASYPQKTMSWTYDRYGNRLTQVLNGGTQTVNPSASTNRLNLTYDTNGNLTNDGTYGLTWDAENRMVSYASGSVTNQYDANSLRVRRTKQGGSDVIYVFAGTQPIAEYVPGALPSNPSTQYVYLGSQLIAAKVSSTYTFYEHDHLSIRGVLSDATPGSPVEQGHLPFGENWYGSSLKWKFSSYERDSDTSDDFAVFRRCQYIYGRFSSPDPVSGYLGDPQSLNRYTYVRNDSVRLTDSFGLATPYPPQEPEGGGGGGGDWFGPFDCADVYWDGILVFNTCDVGQNPPGGGDPTTPTVKGPPSNEVPQNPCNYAGRNPDPSAWAAMGQDTKNNPFTTTYDFVKGFAIGGYLDAQPMATGNSYEKAAYGNYVFGAYMSGAGFPLSVTLAGANEIGFYHSLSNPAQYSGRQMDSFFWSLPAANVANITAGYNAQRNGTLCHK
jgi:RHS repeat-associated protein